MENIKFEVLYKDTVTAVVEIFPRNRVNADDLLHKLGLKNYNPLDIVRKTHGLMRNDYVWIRFEGESLHYDDIKIR